jgi:hypothetical protein
LEVVASSSIAAVCEAIGRSRFREAVQGTGFAGLFWADYVAVHTRHDTIHRRSCLAPKRRNVRVLMLLRARGRARRCKPLESL